MEIHITATRIALDEPLRVYVNQKIGSLFRVLPKGPVQVRVEIGKPSARHKHGRIFYAEINIMIAKTLLRAQAENEDLRTAIDEARDEMKLQIVKFKEKRRDLERKRIDAG